MGEPIIEDFIEGVICACEPQDTYMHFDEFVECHAEGFCAFCMKRATREGDWAECPCCHKRWKYTCNGEDFDLEFNHEKTVRETT
jgi:hypothetical protein